MEDPVESPVRGWSCSVRGHGVHIQRRRYRNADTPSEEPVIRIDG